MWKVVGILAIAVGLVAGVQQLFSAFRRRRFRQAEERVLAAAALSLDAEAAERDYNRYELLRRALRQQVEEEVPREAVQVYLRSRADALAQQIQRDVREFEHVQGELARLSRSEPNELDERLRSVIEHAIKPAYLRQRNTDRAVLILLAALLILSVTPISPRQLVYEYFEVVNSSTDYFVSGVINVVSIAAVLVAGCAALASRWLLHRRSAWRASRWMWVAASSALVVGLGAFAAGLLARERSLREFALAYNAPTVDAQGYSSANGWESTAAGLFDLAVLIGGLGLGMVVGLIGLRWTSLVRRKQHG